MTKNKIEFRTEMFEHQKNGYEKLRHLKVGALYMEMGTGKTRLMLQILADKYNDNKVDKIIWFCPCSAKDNIRKEISKHLKEWCEDIMIVGIESMSSSIRLNSYLLEFVRDNRCLLVVDESLKIKNTGAIRTINITRLGALCKYKYILNGTPISKNETDLFAQWYFLDWRILGYRTRGQFESNHVMMLEGNYSNIEKIVNVKYLTDRIAKFSYQCSKDDMIIQSQKKYEKIYFDMDKKQEENYNYVADYFLENIEEYNTTTIYRLFNNLQAVTSGFCIYFDEAGLRHKSKMFDDVLLNPRISALYSAIESIDKNEKILIFCEYREEIADVIKALSQLYDDEIVFNDGSVNIKQRAINTEAFENNARFMVTNKDCSAFSLNYQFCRNVIFYNNDFDFGTRIQSEDRVHRVGQNKDVRYIDIVADGTIENKIIRCLINKEKLSDWFKEEINRKNKVNVFNEHIFTKNYKRFRDIESQTFSNEEVKELYEDKALQQN